MPDYQGVQYTLLFVTDVGRQILQRRIVDKGEWESVYTRRAQDYPGLRILGRARGLEVELFEHQPHLKAELLAFDNTVHMYDPQNPLTTWGTTLKKRNITQRATDALYDALKDHDISMDYVYICGTETDYCLITTVDKEHFDTSIVYPTPVMLNGVRYKVIGHVLHGEPEFNAPEEEIKAYLAKTRTGDFVSYRLVDFAQTVIDREKEDHRAEKRARQKQSKKAKKAAEAAARTGEQRLPSDAAASAQPVDVDEAVAEIRAGLEKTKV